MDGNNVDVGLSEEFGAGLGLSQALRYSIALRGIIKKDSQVQVCELLTALLFLSTYAQWSSILVSMSCM